MAVKKEDVSAEATEKVQAKSNDKAQVTGSKPENTSKYSIDELVAAEKELGANRIIIRTALKKAQKDLFTIEEAKEIVSKFKKREVK